MRQVLALLEVARSVEQEPHTLDLVRRSATPSTAGSFADYVSSLSADDLLSPAEERELAAGVAAGDLKARERLITANLRLVISIAKAFQGRGRPMDELVQDGNLGLLKAVDRFDHRRGYRFATYATYWIREAISASLIDTGRTIRISWSGIRVLRRIAAAQAALDTALGRAATTSELSLETGVPEQTIEHLRSIAEGPLSLSAPVSEQGDDLGDLLPDRETESTEQQAERALMHAQLAVMLRALPSEYRSTLQLRFGIGGKPSTTLRETAAQLGVSLQKAAALERDALATLRQVAS